jgi:hypothetical protein
MLSLITPDQVENGVSESGIAQALRDQKKSEN